MILCTGLDGTGEWTVLKFISSTLPKSHYAHCGEDIDFIALAARASAFWQRRVSVRQRGYRPGVRCKEGNTLPQEAAVPAYQRAQVDGDRGFLGHFWTLPDLDRWRFMRKITGMSQPPPQELVGGVV